MRRSLARRIGTLVLVAAMAMPALAAPKREDDSPMDRFSRSVSRIVNRVIHVLDLIQIDPPK